MRFEKVSEERFRKDCNKPIEGFRNMKLPRQGSKHSAGMDLFAPFDIHIPPKRSTVVPSGLRWVTEEKDKVLLILPRSGLGFKTGMRLNNTVGVIDADFYESDNEGHIFVNLYNPMDVPILIEEGRAYAQGIVVQYFICDGAASDDSRNGGFGSTG